MKLTDLSSNLKDIFPFLQERDIGEYSYLYYPKKLSFLKMKVKSYYFDDFGFVMSMDTSMMGLMKLSTFSFTPSKGLNIPYLLIDTMSMGNKRIVFIEFYDCRKEKEEIPSLVELTKKYQNIPNYNEKDHWYVHERMPGSLIKSTNKKNETSLVEMIVDTLNLYQEEISQAKINLDNLQGLKEFADKMVTLGNPSSKTLNKVLGEEGAKKFFNEVIMPLESEK